MRESLGCWKGVCLFFRSLAQALTVSSLAAGLLQSLVKWESENKMVCEQRLLKGEGPKTSWSRELTNDGELILVSPAPSHLLKNPLPSAFCAGLQPSADLKAAVATPLNLLMGAVWKC